MKKTSFLLSLLLPFTLLSQNFPLENYSLEAVLAKASPPSNEVDFYVVDSLYCYQFDAASQTDVPVQRQYNLDFTDDGEVLESISQTYLPDVAEWQNAQRVTTAYDGQNQILEEVRQLWDEPGQAWQNDLRTTNQWNPNGMADHVLTERWNAPQMQWRNHEQLIFGYDANGNIELFEVENWDTTAMAWNRVLRIVYTVNAEGQVVAELFQLWQNGMYQSLSRKFFTYTAGLLSVERTEVWDVAAQAWDNSSRSVFGYDSNGNRTEQINQLWVSQDSSWLNQTRILQNFNADGEVTLRTELVWGNAQWVNFFQMNSVYDGVGNLTRFEGSQWAVTEWAAFNSCDFYWRFSHVVATSEVLKLGCDVPNPYGLGTPFSCPNLPQGEKMTLEVFDLSGRLALRMPLDGGNFINIAGPLRPGLYVLSVRGEEGVLLSQKMVVE